MEKAREFQKNIYFCFIDYAKAFDCVDHNILWKILKEMGIPDHLTCLLRNLYAGQEATVRTGHGATNWFQIGKAVHQGCILSHFLFNSLVAQRLKRLPPVRETWVRFLGRKDPLEKEMATHSSILAWRIPWMEKPSRLQSTGLQRVGHDWATSPHLAFIGGRDQYHLQEKEMQKDKMVVWGGLTNSREKKRSERQGRKGEIYPSECIVLKNSKERFKKIK